MLYLDLCRNGARKKLSLRTDKRTVALTRAKAIIAQIDAKIWSLPQNLNLKLDELVARWLIDMKARNCAESTITLNSSVVQRFRNFMAASCKDPGGLSPKEITPDNVQQFLFQRKGETCPATANRDRRIMGSLFSFAVRSEMISKNPVLKTSPIRYPRKIKPVPTEIQIREFLNAASTKDALVHDVAVLISNTGLRLGESLGLEWADIDFESFILNVRSKPLYQLKDKQERQVRLNDAAFQVLRARFRRSKDKAHPVFASRNGKRIECSTLSHSFKRIAAKIGLPWLCPQSLRRAFATINAQKMMPFQLKAILGHSSIRTTESFYINSNAHSEWLPAEVAR